MRGMVFAGLLAAAGCGADVTNVDLGPSAQDAATGGFAGLSDASGGQAGNVATGGLAGGAGQSGAPGLAGVAGSAGSEPDSGPDAEPDVVVEAGEDAAPDGGMDAEGASDAAGEADAELCPCELQPGYACYGNASCTDWCTGLAGWSKYPSIGCWEPNYPPNGSCHAIPAPLGPKTGRFFVWYNESFWDCPNSYKLPPECQKYTYAGNGWGYWSCPFTP